MMYFYCNTAILLIVSFVESFVKKFKRFFAGFMIHKTLQFANNETFRKSQFYSQSCAFEKHKYNKKTLSILNILLVSNKIKSIFLALC